MKEKGVTVRKQEVALVYNIVFRQNYLFSQCHSFTTCVSQCYILVLNFKRFGTILTVVLTWQNRLKILCKFAPSDITD